MSGLLGFAVYIAAVVVPLWLLMPRFGLSPYWALAAVLPIGVPVVLWVLALRDDGSAGGTI